MEIIYGVTGNQKTNKDLPEKVAINNAKVKEKEEIDKYLANFGHNLTSKIPNEQGGFEKYFANCNTVMNNASLTEQLRNIFFVED